MYESYGVVEMIETARSAVHGLSNQGVIGRFDRFVEGVGQMSHTEPDKASMELMDWMSVLDIGNAFTRPETHKLLLAVKQAVFMSIEMNQHTESFDVTFSIAVMPILGKGNYAEAAKKAWSEFIHLFRKTWGSHERLPESIDLALQVMGKD